MKYIFTTLALVAMVLASGATPALAQGGAGSTGVLTGKVVDESGAVLPGVTVTASSPAMMGTPSTTTNEEGIFRFPSVAPGEYKLTFELAGFAPSSREGIRVTIGFTADVSVRMGVQALEETVTVSGESPVIDTAATRVQTNYTQDQLSSLPNARDMWSLLATTPSVTLNRVDVGGSTAGTQTTYFAYGYTGQNRPLIEGINTTEGTSAAGFYLDYGSFEEVFIGAAANSAEMPVPGVLTQFIGRSGSNRLAFNFYYDYENENVQSKNLTPEQVRPVATGPAAFRNDEANRLSGYKNLNVGVGGPIARDRLWFYGAYFRQENEVAQPPSGSIQDGTIFQTKLYNYTGKVTYNLTPNNKFVGYLQHGTKQQPNRTDASPQGGPGNPIHLTKDSTLNQSSPSWVWKGEYNRTMGSNGFLEARMGQFGYNFSLVNNVGGPRYEDLVTSVVSGGGRDWLLKRRRNQVTAAYSWFLDNLLGGNHNVKFGAEMQNETGNTIWNSGFTDQVVHYLRNGAASSVRLYATPSSAMNGLRNSSAFVTDSWVINRLTLNVGARFDRYRIFLPEQEHPVGRFFPVAQTFAEVSAVKVFNHLVPRVGVIFDLTGDGRTLLKGNFGRYYFNPGVNLADSVNPNTADQFSEYTWNDINRDLLYQPGEEGALSRQFGGTSNQSIDPDLKNSYTHELSTFVERQVIDNLGVRAGFVWKKDYDGYQLVNLARPFGAYNVPVSIADPGAPGTFIPAFNLDDLTRTSRNVTTNIDDYEGTYKTLEVAANKRWSRRWSMSASYSYTWSREFGATYFGNRIGTAIPNYSLTSFGNYPDNPNEHTEHDFTNWNLKLHGTVEPFWGLRFTPVFKSQSGAPYGRVVRAALNYNAAQPILVEPVGARRQETINVLDVRVEKQLHLADRARVGLFFDVFNVANANTAININWVTGPTFEYPVTVLPPRIAKFGVKVDW